MCVHDAGCIICGSPLKYSDVQEMHECAVCHGQFLSNACCVKGHFVCDRCHMGQSIDLLPGICAESSSKDPLVILDSLMSLSGIHMHGPEHHVLVGSALIAAYRNAGGDIDLVKALNEMRNRSENIPGGVCGNWGACGAAISCGIAYSIINGTTPLSSDTWAEGNLMTAKCLESVSGHGGPRCCKRDGYLALQAAVKFIRKHKGVRMDQNGISCRFSSNNRQCLGKKCPFFGKR